MLKKILIGFILFNMMIMTGCSSGVKETASVTVSTAMTSSVNSLKFISENNYSGTDVSDIVNGENDDKIYYSFRLKNKIKVAGNYDRKNIVIDSIITANKDADINDIVNCCVFAIDGNSSNIDKDNYKTAILKSIENKDSKIDIPVEKGSMNIKENYVLTDDDSISIHVTFN